MHELTASPDTIEAQLKVALLAKQEQPVTLFLQPGIYNQIQHIVGTGTYPLAIRGIDRTQVIIDAGTRDIGLELHNIAHVTLHDMTITGSTRYGIHSYNCDHIGGSGLLIRDCAGSGLSISKGTRGAHYRNFEIHDCTRTGWGIFEARDVLLELGYSHDNDKAFNVGATGDGGHKISRTQNVVIRDMVHRHCRHGVWVDADVGGVVLHNNLFTDLIHHGIALEACSHVLAQGNRIYRAAVSGLFFANVAHSRILANHVDDCKNALFIAGTTVRNQVFDVYGNEYAITKLDDVTIAANHLAARAGQQLTQLDGSWKGTTARWLGNQYTSVDPRAFNGYGHGMKSFPEWQVEVDETGTWTQR